MLFKVFSKSKSRSAEEEEEEEAEGNGMPLTSLVWSLFVNVLRMVWACVCRVESRSRRASRTGREEEVSKDWIWVMELGGRGVHLEDIVERAIERVWVVRDGYGKGALGGSGWEEDAGAACLVDAAGSVFSVEGRAGLRFFLVWAGSSAAGATGLFWALEIDTSARPERLRLGLLG